MTTKIGTKTEFQFQDAKTRKVLGVQIFAIGEHTDSQGAKRTWTRPQLLEIVAKFEAKIPSSVAIKLGHTSPEHTKSIADSMGIPEAVLMGENGRGAARLGTVINLSLDDVGILVADFEVVEAVAGFIESKMFNTVSAEILPDYQGQGPVLSGVALLGADRPALKELAGLQNAVLASEGSGTPLLYYSDYVSLHAVSAESVYRVPITQVDTENGRVIQRLTTVQHVRADNERGARRMVVRILERTASSFGQILGQGAAHIVILLVAGYVGREVQRRYNIGDPFLIKSETTTDRTTTRRNKKGDETSRSTVKGTVIRRSGSRRRFFDQGKDQPAQEFAVGAMFLGIVGVYTLTQTLFQVFLANRDDNKPAQVDAWAHTPKEAQDLVQAKFAKSWKTIKIQAVVGAALASAKELAGRLFAEDLKQYALHGTTGHRKARVRKKKSMTATSFAQGLIEFHKTDKKHGHPVVELVGRKRQEAIGELERNLRKGGNRNRVTVMAGKTRLLIERKQQGFLRPALITIRKFTEGLIEFHKSGEKHEHRTSRIVILKGKNKKEADTALKKAGVEAGKFRVRGVKGARVGLVRHRRRFRRDRILAATFAQDLITFHKTGEKHKHRGRQIAAAVLGGAALVAADVAGVLLPGGRTAKKALKKLRRRTSKSRIKAAGKQTVVRGKMTAFRTKRRIRQRKFESDQIAGYLYKFHKSDTKHRHITAVTTERLKGRDKRRANKLLKRSRAAGGPRDRAIAQLPGDKRRILITKKRRRFRRDIIRAGVFAEKLHAFHVREDGKPHRHIGKAVGAIAGVATAVGASVLASRIPGGRKLRRKIRIGLKKRKLRKLLR